jgi:hypothetical protein
MTKTQRRQAQIRVSVRHAAFIAMALGASSADAKDWVYPKGPLPGWAGRSAPCLRPSFVHPEPVQTQTQYVPVPYEAPADPLRAARDVFYQRYYEFDGE